MKMYDLGTQVGQRAARSEWNTIAFFFSFRSFISIDRLKGRVIGPDVYRLTVH